MCSVNSKSHHRKNRLLAFTELKQPAVTVVKCARVTPLFRQGERDYLNNYRPILVISVVAKEFERTVYDQLYACLEERNIIYKYQSGFRAFHSTVTALLESSDTWA